MEMDKSQQQNEALENRQCTLGYSLRSASFGDYAFVGTHSLKRWYPSGLDGIVLCQCPGTQSESVRSLDGRDATRLAPFASVCSSLIAISTKLGKIEANSK